MTIQEIAQRITEAEKASLIRADLACEANIQNTETHIHQGRKWTRLDVGQSGRYMINQEGQIYGIKAYGVPHLGHPFGTLAEPSPALFRGRWDR
jgi:hypothetical protein